MLSVDEVCSIILGQLGSKFRFWSVFGVSFQEGTHFMGSLVLSNSPSEPVCAMARCAEQHTVFCTSRAFGIVSGHPQGFLLWCFDAILINIVTRRSFTLIWIGFINLRRTLNEKWTWIWNNRMMIFLKQNDDVMTCFL